MQKITTFLWFDDQAEEAASFYVRTFNDRPGSGKRESKIAEVTRYGEAGPGRPGSVMVVRFELDGQEFNALNGGPDQHFTEAISLMVHCDTQEEVDHFWNTLSEGGTPNVCGWLKDRYGLSWQIVPDTLFELMSDPDPVKSQAVMKAMLQMTKIEIPGLRRAYEAA